tara:strand:+ start:474 stop:644 length:171 start_codon:yes stop_codon:yes gene_type:complete
MRQCYIPSIRSISLINNKEFVLWDTQRNTEEEGKWAQRKEELVKEIKKNNNLSGSY